MAVANQEGPLIDASASRLPRTRRTSRDERYVVVVFAVAAAVLAAFGGAAPTGIALVDVIYVGMAGATLSLAGGRSRRIPWLVSGLATLWLTPTTVGRIAAIAALSLAVYSVRAGRRRSIGALVGALLAFALADLGSGPFLGATTLFALVAASPILISGAILMPPHWRRPVARTMSTWVALAAMATLVFGFIGLLTIGDLGDGVRSADRGFDAASDGDEDRSADAFDSSARSFERARARVSSFWTLPARLVPGVGQHVRAVQVVTAEGVALVDAAGDTARSVDPDEVRLVDGGLDLDLIESFQPVLERAERALDRASERIGDVRSPWLVSPLDDRLAELLDELDDARPSAHTAALAARQLPAMLGSDEPVHWLVALTTPAEARGLGGLLGNWVLVEADEGKIEIVLSGRNEDVNERLRANTVELVGPEQYLRRWGRFSPEEFFQDVTLSPDLPMVAEVTADLFEKAMERDVDGVMFLDPFAISAVLELSGPVATTDFRLTDATVVPFLLEDQYIEYQGDELGRVFAINQLVHGAFDAFTTGELPGPRVIADVLAPVIEQDRMGVWWQPGGGPDELIADTSLDGRFPDAGTGELLALVHQNAGQNKLDPHLRREVDYRLRIVDGEADALIAITLHNDVTDLSLPNSIIGSNDQGYPLGTNVARLTVHTSLDLVTARLDGEPFLVERETAFGHDAITALIEVPPGGSRLLEIDATGRSAGSVADFQLTLPYQPLVNDDIVRLDIEIDGVEVTLPSSLLLVADTVLDASGE